MGKWHLLLLLMLLVTPFAKEVSAETVIGSKTVFLHPIADAYVNSTNPNANYGSSNSLIIHTNSYECHSYIMFNLSSIPSNAVILSAELRVRLAHVSGYNCEIGAHRSSDSSWKESELTWSNKPAFESQATAAVKLSGLVFLGYKAWNITVDAQVMRSTGRLTEVLVLDWSDQYTHADFDSRETKSNRPELEIQYVTAPIYSVHLESLQDTGATSNIGSVSIITEYDSGWVTYTETLPQDVAVAGGSYNVTYNSGYAFMRWETGGGVRVSDASSKSTIVTVTGQGTLRAVGSSRRIEYLYDDGTSDAEVGSARNPGDIAAVRFTPLITNKLLAVRFHFTYCYKHTISVHVMDSSRRDLITAFDQTPTFEQPYSTHGWFDVDLSNYDVTLNAGMDYYIGMEWKTKGDPSLGCDWSRWMKEPYDPAEDRSWIWNGTNWEIVARNNYMIRAVIGVPKASTTISCSVSPSSITFDSEVIVSGSLSPAQPGTSITLTYTRPDKSTFSKTVVAESDGSYKDTYMPDKVGLWNVEAKWAGSEEYREATSPAASFAVTKASSTISCSLSASTAPYKTPITISGSITPTYSGVQVQIEYSADNGSTWNDMTYGKTDSKGAYTLSWIPPNIGTYLVRSYWLGDEGHNESTSQIQYLNVTKLESKIDCYVLPTQLTRGQPTTIGGRIYPSHEAMITVCYSVDNGVTWVNVTQVSSGKDGTYSCTWTPSTDGSYQVKTIWNGDTDHTRAESQIQTLLITKPTSTTTSTTTSSPTTTSTTPTKTSSTTSTTTSTTTSSATSTATQTNSTTTTKSSTSTTSPQASSSTATETASTKTSTTSTQSTEVNLVLYALPLIVALAAAIVVVVVLLMILPKRRKGFQPPPPAQQYQQ